MTDGGALHQRLQDIDKRLPVGNADTALYLGNGAFDEGTHEQTVDGYDQQRQAEITDPAKPFRNHSCSPPFTTYSATR